MPSSSPVIRNEIEPLRLAATGFEMIEHGGDRAGDAALHVDGAAAIEQTVGGVAVERRLRPRASSPAGTTSVWPAKVEVRCAGADARVEILDVGGARFAERDAMRGEAPGFQHIARAGQGRRLRAGVTERAADEVAGEGDGDRPWPWSTVRSAMARPYVF